MVKRQHIKKIIFLLFASAIFMNAEVCCQNVLPQNSNYNTTTSNQKKKNTASRILYGQASFYAAKFAGRKTATGEIFSQGNLTAACNVLPLGTWIRITNLRNGKAIVVRTNDRLHPKTRRIVDLTRTGAQKLGYIKSGLTRVKVEVLNQKPYKKIS